MPTYQYTCTLCAQPLEAVQSFDAEPLTECPACGGRLRKVFSSVGVVFKGSGFYRTDSREKPGAAGKPGSDGAGTASEAKPGREGKAGAAAKPGKETTTTAEAARPAADSKGSSKGKGGPSGGSAPASSSA